MAASKTADASSAISGGQATAFDIAPDTAASGGWSVRSKRVAGTVWACLVVAEDKERREQFDRMAVQAGWHPIACGSVGEAVRESERWKTQLAIIDLGRMSPVRKSSFLGFASRIAARERLLMISDEPTVESPEVEQYARQIGAWMYLASPDFKRGLKDLLGEARQVAEKLGADPTVGA